MAEKRLAVLIALADRERAEELAAYLAEYEGMLPLLRDEVDPTRLAGSSFDAVVSDRASTNGAPTVLLGESQPAAANVPAVLKATAADSVIAAAIRLTAAGYRVVPETARIADTSAGHEPAAPVQLTHREREVIALLAEGASNKLIARRLGISAHTAKFHVAAILQKLGAINRTDAIAIAMREGLVLI